MKIPEYIKVGVYYWIDDDGGVIFDGEEMEREFKEKMEELENKF